MMICKDPTETLAATLSKADHFRRKANRYDQMECTKFDPIPLSFNFLCAVLYLELTMIVLYEQAELLKLLRYAVNAP